jgi:hypothetical protein
MTETTASDYNAAAVDRVVRTLRAVAEATPIDPPGVTDEPAIVLVPGPVIDGSVHRRRRVRGLGVLTAAAAAALLAVMMLARDGGQVQTASSDEPTPAAASHRVADDKEVARGEADGRMWRLAAWPAMVGTEIGKIDDGICVELTVDGLLNGDRGWCGSVPTDETAFGWFAQDSSAIEGSVFVYGAVGRKAAEVTVELSDGEELAVKTTPPAFGFRYFVTPIPSGSAAVGMTAFDEEGVELSHV